MWSPVPILEAHGVRLSPNGADRYRCTCPIHRGNGLSMSVAKGKDRWQISCFACGFGGNTPDLLMALDNVTIAEALRKLGAGTEKREAAPVVMYPADYVMLVCDRCGDACRVEGQTYKVPGREGPLWTTTPLEEVFAMESRGWEISARAEFALCPECLS